MKKKINIWVIGIAVFAVIIAAWAAAFSYKNSKNVSEENLSLYKKDQDMIMEKMMKDMLDIPTSENAAVDFLEGMIPHHESAAAMAQSYIKHGGNQTSLKPMADEIITVQRDEIKQMKTLIKKLNTRGHRTNGRTSSYMKEYRKMFHQAHSGHTASDNPSCIDEAFAEGMIQHHQMAVDMSKLVLKYTRQKDTVKLAQKIIRTQQDEISRMSKVLKEQSPSHH
ncbi:DUF305 domain-containing protein [Anaerostipes sp.]|uniref:DUF305 domain-containing protein n=1 Tax=Anaerostipes sp. TaxID=1872530 RepID=UPI0025C4C7E0|nr:DUF305 domain-containing protein [Anaerostipes sp.]MBS7007356.1 DUF305 domain-containing protein [Anaerostipes sp.]